MIGTSLRDNRGSIALEFGICCPILLLLFCAGFEIPQLVRANAKVENATRTIANLVALQTEITSIADFCNAAQLIMAPFDPADLSTTVASVSNKKGVVAADWQDATCGGATMQNPAGAAGALVPNDGDSVVIVSSTYTYRTSLSYVLPAATVLSNTTFARPRNNKTIGH